MQFLLLDKLPELCERIIPIFFFYFGPFSSSVHFSILHPDLVLSFSTALVKHMVFFFFLLPDHKILYSYSSIHNFIHVLLHTLYLLLLCYIWKLLSGGKGQGRGGKRKRGSYLYLDTIKIRELLSCCLI